MEEKNVWTWYTDISSKTINDGTKIWKWKVRVVATYTESLITKWTVTKLNLIIRKSYIRIKKSIKTTRRIIKF